jgi:hypothetical protein
MNEGFDVFLKKGGRSESAISRIMAYVQEFEQYLIEFGNCELIDADSNHLEAFITWVEQTPTASAKGHLWGLKYYFEFIDNQELMELAGLLRQSRIVRKPFPLRKFRDINSSDLDKLEAVGIKNAKQILSTGATAKMRTELTERTGVAESVILELVKLSDLSRIPGVKGIRSRLYHDAGVDTLEKLAASTPDALMKKLNDFVDQTGFDGIAPFLAEIKFTISTAKEFPDIVEY